VIWARVPLLTSLRLVFDLEAPRERFLYLSLQANPRAPGLLRAGFIMFRGRAGFGRPLGCVGGRDVETWLALQLLAWPTAAVAAGHRGLSGRVLFRPRRGARLLARSRCCCPTCWWARARGRIGEPASRPPKGSAGASIIRWRPRPRCSGGLAPGGAAWSCSRSCFNRARHAGRGRGRPVCSPTGPCGWRSGGGVGVGESCALVLLLERVGGRSAPRDCRGGAWALAGLWLWEGGSGSRGPD